MQLQTLLSFKPSGWVPFSWSTVFFSSCLGQRSEHAVSGLRCEGVWLIRYFGGWRPRSALQQGFVPSSRLCVSYARHLWLVRQAGPHRPPLFLVKLLATMCSFSGNESPRFSSLHPQATYLPLPKDWCTYYVCSQHFFIACHPLTHPGSTFHIP